MSAAADEAFASLSTPAGLADPYPVYAKIRTETPCYRSEMLGAWVFSRFDDCQRVLADGETFLVIDVAWRDDHTPGWRDTPARVLLANLLPWKNPPAHTRERRLLARDFTVRRVHSLEPAVRRAVDTVLDRFEEQGTTEFVDTVLYPLSMAVIGDLVGVPESDHAELRRVTDLVGKQVDPQLAPELRAEVDAAATAYRDYFTDLIALRRKAPRDDLTSALIGKHDADPEQMSDDDVLNSLLVLFGAGYETTAGALGNGLHALLTHPDQFAQLTADPGLAAGTTEEILRWDGSAALSQRSAATDTEVGGTTIAAGETVFLLNGAANRDPARFTDPDTFAITRDEGRGLFFGHGLHLCLGAALARLEMTTLLEQVAKRFPNLTLAGPAVRRKNMALRGMDSLPVSR